MAGFDLELNGFEARYREYEKWNTLGAAHFLLSSAPQVRTFVGAKHGELKNE